MSLDRLLYTHAPQSCNKYDGEGPIKAEVAPSSGVVDWLTSTGWRGGLMRAPPICFAFTHETAAWRGNKLQ